MRELEFLPSWYPRLRRHKRYAAMQAWASLAIVVLLCAWLSGARKAVHAEEIALLGVETRLARSENELQRLEELLALQKQLRHQKGIIAKVGLHVESTRLLSTLEQSMGTGMAIIDLSLQTEERASAIVDQYANVAGARPAPRADTAQAPVERYLHVRLVGVAPTDADLAEFLARIGSMPFFQNVSMTYAKDRVEAGHVMREFEITFSMNLNVEGK